jgi:hypothetical protein
VWLSAQSSNVDGLDTLSGRVEEIAKNRHVLTGAALRMALDDQRFMSAR